jgi:hypothetical protein
MPIANGKANDYLSNAKIQFQSLSMPITIQPFFCASLIKAHR